MEELKSQADRESKMKKLFIIIIVPFTLFALSLGSQVSFTPCSIGGYVIDTDPAGLNVRSGPGTGYEVIGKLPTGTDGVIVEIIGVRGNWFFIHNASGIDFDVNFKGRGWVYASLLGTQVRGNAEADTAENYMKVKLFSSPGERSSLAGVVHAESSVTLLSCQGRWAKIRLNNVIGWLAPDNQCPNPVTTCP